MALHAELVPAFFLFKDFDELSRTVYFSVILSASCATAAVAGESESDVELCLQFRLLGASLTFQHLLSFLCLPHPFPSAEKLLPFALTKKNLR